MNQREYDKTVQIEFDDSGTQYIPKGGKLEFERNDKDRKELFNYYSLKDKMFVVTRIIPKKKEDTVARLDKNGLEKDIEKQGALSPFIAKIEKKYGLKNPSAQLGVRLFRHSFISYQYQVKKINADQKLQLSYLMNHSTEEAKRYNWALEDKTAAGNKLPPEYVKMK